LLLWNFASEKSTLFRLISFNSFLWSTKFIINLVFI
jgi:hypothetical protein